MDIKNRKFKLYINIENSEITYDFLDKHNNINKLVLNAQDIKEITWSFFPIEVFKKEDMVLKEDHVFLLRVITIPIEMFVRLLFALTFTLVN